MRDILVDIRHASLVLRSAPVTAGVAVLSLSMAVAGAVSAFAVIDAFLLRTVSVDQPHRLVSVWMAPREGAPSDLSVPMFRAFIGRQRVFSHAMGWVGDLVLNVETGPQIGLANVWAVTDDFFVTLGESAAVGRLLERSGDEIPADSVVIGDRLWRERFGNDPAVIGRTIRIEGRPFTVVGVSRPTFTGPSLGVAIDATVPLAALPQLREALGQRTDVLNDPTYLGLAVGGRLADGLDVTSACAQLDSWWQGMLKEAVPAASGGRSNDVLRDSRVRCSSAAYGVNADVRAATVRPFYLVLGLAAVVAAIGALHVALLLQQLMVRRTHDLAVRLALGASRWRLLRHVLVLGGLVAVAGVAAGSILAQWGSQWMVAVVAGRGFLPLAVDVGVTVPVLAVSATLAVLLTLLSCVASCAFVLRQAPTLLATAARPRTAAQFGIAASALLVAQIAGVLALLVVTSTLNQSLDAWTAGTDGLRQRGLLMSRLMPRPAAYAALDDDAYYRALVNRVASVPGVVAAGLSIYEAGAAWQYETHVAPTTPKAAGHPTVLAWVSPGFLDTLELTVRQGRDFSWSDTRGQDRVAIISAGLAQTLFPDGDALGRHIQLSDAAVPSALRIVGVARDARVFDLRRPAQPTVYVPWSQAPTDYLHWASHVVLRHTGDQRHVVAAVRDAVAGLGKEYVFSTRPAAEVGAQAMAIERLARTLASFYSALTLLLTAMGLFGALALVTTRRTREIGIRMALGAGRAQIVGLVLWQTLWVVLAGFLVSVPLAIAFDRGLRSQVVGLAAPTPSNVLLAVAAVVAVCALGAYVPVRRAARTAPATAMRSGE